MSADIVLRTTDAVTLRPLSPSIVSVGALGPQGSAGTGGVVAHYGAFTDTGTHQATANVATAVPFNFTEATNGVVIGDVSSKIVVENAGTYSVTWSGQFRKVSGGTEKITVWVAINGVNVARTATDIQIAGNNTEQLETINWVFEFQDDDYLELYWSDPGGDVQLLSVAARSNPTRPVVPSSILTVVQVTNEGPQGPQGPQREARSDWVSPNSYIGIAAKNASESSEVWKITRITVSGNQVTVATASPVAWSNRLSANYS